MLGTGDDTIVLPTKSVLQMDTLVDGDAYNAYGPTATPIIFSTITIEGNGATLQWNRLNGRNVRLFAIGPASIKTPNATASGTGSLTLRNVYVKGFHAKGGDGRDSGGGGLGAGGAIYLQGGVLVVDSSTFDGNQAVGGNGGTGGDAGGGGGFGGNGGRFGFGPFGSNGGGGGGARGDGGDSGRSGGTGGGGGTVFSGGSTAAGGPGVISVVATGAAGAMTAKAASVPAAAGVAEGFARSVVRAVFSTKPEMGATEPTEEAVVVAPAPEGTAVLAAVGVRARCASLAHAAATAASAVEVVAVEESVAARVEARSAAARAAMERGVEEARSAARSSTTVAP